MQDTVSDQRDPAPSAPSAADTAAIALVTLLAYHELTADPQSVLREFAAVAEPHISLALVRAACGAGLKARLTTARLERLDTLPLPAIARAVDGSYVVLAKAGANGSALVKEAAKPPEEWTAEQLKDRWSGEIILLTRRFRLGEVASGFGMSWFVPELLRFKTLFSEVLIISFFIQLLGLVTPLFS